MNDPLERYITALEQAKPDDLAPVLACLASDVHFRDPFNDCRGRDAFAHVLEDMFEQIGACRFRVLTRGWADNAGDSRVALIRWELSATPGTRALNIDGCSELHFDSDDRVCVHFDFWDAGGAVYERVPLLGTILSVIRRRISAS